MKKNVRRWRLAAVGLVFIALLAVLVKYGLAPNNAPQYLTAKVERGDLENAVLATGTLHAFKQVDVGAQVSGQIKSLKVALGDSVEKGQWLAEIDPVISRNQLRLMEAAVDRLVAQKRGMDAQLARAELAALRQQQMLAADATSRQAYEEARSALDTKRSELASLDAQIRAARIEVETAQANLNYTRIMAPMGGEVVAIVALEGQTVIAQQQAPVILKLADLETITVKAQISEADVIRVRPGHIVYFTILGDPDKRYYGKLRAVEPAPHDFAAMQSSPGGGGGGSKPGTAVFYNALFEVPNPDHRLRIAMTAQVSVVLDTVRGALTVAAGALGDQGADGRYAVRVLDADGKVVVRRVRIGLNNGVKAEVRDGLKLGERVVTGSVDDSVGASFSIGM